MPDKQITIEVAYATLVEQFVIELQLAAESTAIEAIEASGILQQHPEIDLDQLKLGVFGQLCPPEQKLNTGDRVEIYRPLQQAPMAARRNRITK